MRQYDNVIQTMINDALGDVARSTKFDCIIGFRYIPANMIEWNSLGDITDLEVTCIFVLH